MPDGKRDSERIDLPGPLHGEVTVFQPTEIRQMSRGGMQVETAFPMQLDSLHQFRLVLAEDRSVIVTGRVVHSRVSEMEQDMVTYRSGVEFVEPSDHVASAIAEFIEIVRRARENV